MSDESKTGRLVGATQSFHTPSTQVESAPPGETLAERRGSGEVATDDAIIGKTLDGRFVIREQLGRGGLGNVYRALQSSIGREVAVKIIAPHVAQTQTVVRRFLREARIASHMKHPNSVVVHDFGQADGHLFIVMELIDGVTLSHYIAEHGALPADHVRAIARQVCAAVGHAHEQDVVHRDLKPSNIMLRTRDGRPEHVTVLDFGLAKSLDGDASATLSNEAAGLVGTPLYMAPEIIDGGAADKPADLYSLGCILYQMATGEPPFTAPSVAGVLSQHMTAEPPPIDRDDLGELPAMIRRLLAKKPGDRPSIAALRECLDARSTVAATQPPRPRVSRIAGFALGLLVAVVGLAAWIATSRDQSSTQESPPAPTRPAPRPAEAAAPTPTTPPPTRAAQAVPATDIDAAPAQPAVIRVPVRSSPRAVVHVDGRRIGRTPRTLSLAAGKTVRIELRRAGYVRHAQSFAPRPNSALDVTLRKRPRSKRNGATTRTGTGTKPAPGTGDRKPPTTGTLDLIDP